MELTSSPDEVKKLLEAGSVNAALDLMRMRDTRDINDSNVHVSWADVLEEMELTDEAIVELNLAIRDDPDRFELYPRLAEILLDGGHPDRAARTWTAMMKRFPSNPTCYEGLGSCLKEAREFEKARDIYQTGFEKTGDVRFKSLLEEMGFLEVQEIASDLPDTSRQMVPEQHHLVTFTTLFSGREGLYARQWVSPTGESGYSPFQEPLSLNSRSA